MDAEQVIQKILSEAKAQAEQILNDAKAKADGQKIQLDAELAEFEIKTGQLAEAAARDKLQRMLANARMDNAKRYLQAKVQILDDVFEKAKSAVNQLPTEQYLSLTAALMKKAVETGDEEIIVGRNESRIDQEFIKRINRELGPGFQGNLRLSQQRGDFTGGFILSRGRVRANASTDVLIETLRGTMVTTLAQDLFSE